MKRTLISPGILIVILFSCEENNISESDNNCLEKHYYYEQSEKISIGSNILQNYIFIGFDYSATNSEIYSFIEDEATLDSNFEVEINEYNINSKKALCKFTSSMNCSEIKNIIEKFYKNEIVIFASYVYDCDMLFGGVQYDYMSYSDEFLVKVENSDNLDELNTIADQTGTIVKSEVYMMPNWYTLSSNKNSQGNALEMANFFYETGKFKNAVPNFYRIELE
ncbi:MAG: hypothetical protein A2W99_16180 [Bacteroidetes bacterium GWF2_33_16]|nr:MAG: hypothetical protein A2X00_12355 [Bacteroidetes bacterium GWE2_32_14]OFY08555.1 MAG: hypothetical protein A2W99_16180 [Bacteroidetes bacterium GWF2_33_16]